MSGVDFEGRELRKGATEAICQFRQGARRRRPRLFPGDERPHRAQRRHAAGRLRRAPPARHHPPQGHRQGRHEGAHRAASPHGHSQHHDHRRQSADRRGHRRRSRRGRFPGPGHAQRQARIHQEGAGGRASGRDDRRRHQRRARARASRCRPRDEHRHHGRQGSRQHGGPRQQSRPSSSKWWPSASSC